MSLTSVFGVPPLPASSIESSQPPQSNHDSDINWGGIVAYIFLMIVFIIVGAIIWYLTFYMKVRLGRHIVKKAKASDKQE